MLKGMTGYGRSSRDQGAYKVTVEVRTVNHRYREIAVRLPRSLAYLEAPLRRRIGDRLGRGRADATVQFDRLGAEPARVVVDGAVVRGLLQAADTLQRDHGIRGELTLEALLRFPEVVSSRPAPEELSDEERATVESVVDEALDAVDAMRGDEGRLIEEDLRARLATVGRLRDEIEARARSAPEILSRRLHERLAELLPDGTPVDPDRLAQEIALLGERADVSEELVRLGGYLAQAAMLLDESGRAGKKLDFMLQEMNRETNTIASKAADGEVGERVVEIKMELDRIREQVQNLV